MRRKFRAKLTQEHRYPPKRICLYQPFLDLRVVGLAITDADGVQVGAPNDVLAYEEGAPCPHLVQAVHLAPYMHVPCDHDTATALQEGELVGVLQGFN